MTIYKIWLTPQYNIEYSLNDRINSTYIGSLDTNEEDLTILIDFCQMSVNACLNKLAEKAFSPNNSNKKMN